MRASLYGTWYILAQRPHHLADYLGSCGHDVEIHTTRGFRSSTPPTLRFNPRLRVGRLLPSRFDTYPVVGPMARAYNKGVAHNVYRGFERSGADFHIHYGIPLPVSTDRERGVKRLIYDCIDDWSAFAGADPRRDNWERALCERADAIWVVSRHLQEKLAPYAGKVRYVPNGVDYVHFAQALAIRQAIDVMPSRPSRLIYIGAVYDWFDARLVGELAKILNEWTIDLIGPVALTREGRRYLDRPNIHFLGPKDYAKLPLALAEADVAMIPFLINDLTRGTSPIKLYEYLAAGVPVAATPMPEVLPYCDTGVVGCADTPLAFADLVRTLAAKANPRRAQEVAKTSSWQARFQPEFERISASLR